MTNRGRGVTEEAATWVRPAAMVRVFFLACGVVSCLLLLVELRDHWQSRLAGIMWLCAVFAVAAALPTTAERAAVMVVGLAVAGVSVRYYEARRPKRSRTRR